MQQRIEGIHVRDELNLFLVAHGLKPASWLQFSPLNFESGYDLTQEGDFIHIYAESDIQLKFEDTGRFTNLLHSLNLSYTHSTEYWPTYSHSGKPIKCERVNFTIGRDDESLENLLSAKTDEEMGIALGYPIEAVRSFGTVIEGERKVGSSLQVALAKAKRAGVELPTWLAYLSHVPEEFDFIGNKVSKTSQELGKRYQSFVRQNNAGLANRIEQYFLSRKLPDAWTKTPSGEYGLTFHYTFAKKT